MKGCAWCLCSCGNFFNVASVKLLIYGGSLGVPAELQALGMDKVTNSSHPLGLGGELRRNLKAEQPRRLRRGTCRLVLVVTTLD